MLLLYSSVLSSRELSAWDRSLQEVFCLHTQPLALLLHQLLVGRCLLQVYTSQLMLACCGHHVLDSSSTYNMQGTCSGKETEGYLHLLSSPQQCCRHSTACYLYGVHHQSSTTGTSGARSFACARSRNPSASHCSGCCRATCMPGMHLHGSKQYLLVEWL